MDGHARPFEKIDPNLCHSGTRENAFPSSEYYAAAKGAPQAFDSPDSPEKHHPDVENQTSLERATQFSEHSESAYCSARSFEYPDPQECLEQPLASPYFAQRPYPCPSSNLVCTSHSSQTSDYWSSENDLDKLDCDEEKKILCDVKGCKSAKAGFKFTPHGISIHKAVSHCLGRATCSVTECSDLGPFNNWRELAKHQRVCHRDGLWLCPETSCSKNFTSGPDLMAHTNLVHAERRWVCSRTDCYFYQQSRRLTKAAYNMHMIEHAIEDDPEATQPCLMCGIHVKVSEAAVHLAYYHAESLQCQDVQCGLVFKSDGNRSAHEWIAHGLNAKKNAQRTKHLETGDTNPIYLTEQFEQDLITQGDTKTFLLPPLYDILEKHEFVFEELSNTSGTQRRKLFLNDLFLVPEERGVKRDIWDWNRHILDTNPTLKIRMMLTNNGRCEGPQPLRKDKYSYEECNKAINLHTCKLRVAYHSSAGQFEDILSFQHRCYECLSEMRMNTLLRSLDLYDKSCSTKERECTFEGCDRLVASKHSPVCFNHLIYHYFRNKYSVVKSWSGKGSSKGVRELIKTRRAKLSSQLKMLASVMQPDPADDNVSEPPIEIHRYVFIDTEFCTFLASENSVILQEIAILDIYGQRILHHFIDWQRSESGLAAPRHQIGSSSVDEDFDSSHSAMQSPGSPITVQQLWNEMIEVGIRSDTVIIEWSTSGADINVLRRVTHYFGLQNILLPKNYISPLLAWRDYISEFPSMAMDVLFPAVFPDSPLVGRNYNALPDAIMLWKLTALLCESAKPIETLVSKQKDQGPVESGDDLPVLEAAVHPFRSRLFGYARARHESKPIKKLKKKRKRTSNEERAGNITFEDVINHNDVNVSNNIPGVELVVAPPPLGSTHAASTYEITDGPPTKKPRAVNDAKQMVLAMTAEEKLTCRIVDARLRGASFPEIFKALKQSSEMKLSYQQVWGRFQEWKDSQIEDHLDAWRLSRLPDDLLLPDAFVWTRKITDWLLNQNSCGLGPIKLADKLLKHFNISVLTQSIKTHLRPAAKGKLESYFEQYQHSPEECNLERLKRHAWNDEQIAFIVQKKDEGLSKRTICKQFNLYFQVNISKGSIRYQYEQWLSGKIDLGSRLSLTREHTRRPMAGNWTNHQIGWITKERQQGRTINHITKDFCEKFGAISTTKVMEICDRHLDEEHAKQFIRRFRYTDEEVGWIIKELQKAKTRRSIVKDFSQKFGRKVSVKSIKRISFEFLHDIRDEKTKFNKLTEEQVGWLIKERQRGRSFKRIVMDFGETFGEEISVGISRKIWRINSTGEKTAKEKKDDEDEGEGDENEYDDDKGDKSEDDKYDDNDDDDNGDDDDDDEWR